MFNPDSKIKLFWLNKSKIPIKQIGIIIIASLVFIGIIVGVKVFYKSQFIKKENLVNLSALLEKENKKMEMPIGFPKDLPILEPNNILQAYIRDQQTKDITVAIDSKKSVKDNFNYYLDYGKKNGWQINEARNITDKLPGKLLLRKDKLTLSFSFKDKAKGGSEVIISSTTFNLTVDKFKSLPRFLGPPIQPEEKIPAENLVNPFLNQPKPKEEKIPAKAGQVPEGFLKDFPLNGKTKIIEAYTLKTENQFGAVYVVKFKSDKTGAENIQFYQNWFKKNNWLLNNQKPENESTLVSASKPFVNVVEVEITAKGEVEVRYRVFR